MPLNVRQLYLPVRRPYRLGVQTPFEECAWVNIMPSAASASRRGVAAGEGVPKRAP
jgi:hypothetical protein